MCFVWDEVKNKVNKQKHDISFELARQVFDDPYIVSWLDKYFTGHQEERWISIGCICNTVIILVVHTFRRDEDDQEIIRLISARKATKKESEKYFEYRK